MQRTLLFTVALLTFLLGTTLAGVHRWMVNSLDEPAEVPPVDTHEAVTPLRIGIFIGVDGATLSADGKKFGFYEPYNDRETLIPLSPAELNDLANQLRSAGLFEEAEFNASSFVSLPQSHTIIVAWPDKRRRFTWITRDECSVPEKYLKIFERLNSSLKLALIHDFIAHNRRRV